MFDCYDVCPIRTKRPLPERVGVALNWDVDGDGVADCNEIDGCTDITACNWNPRMTTEVARIQRGLRIATVNAHLMQMAMAYAIKTR